jgi:hypothetical protein
LPSQKSKRNPENIFLQDFTPCQTAIMGYFFTFSHTEEKFYGTIGRQSGDVLPL